MLPKTVRDSKGWAADIYGAFEALELEPKTENLCAAVAVTEQESSFTVDPVVPGLGAIARAEIDRRAANIGVPLVIVHAALRLESKDGKSYGQRIDAVRTEKQLSTVYEEFIGKVPLGLRLFGSSNPVRTGGPMQVRVSFAEEFARERSYPYPVDGSIRHEVFSRRGGMYFGIAHLLGYPAEYDRPLYRFADFNAGWYASRNAAFQRAVSVASGIELELDGDLIRHGSDEPGATETAVRSLAKRLELSDRQIHRALEQGDTEAFERTSLYERVFAVGEKSARGRLARALVPRIKLQSPKFTRKLTTAWFAERVEQRFKKCMAKAGK